ncbi:hypothetical protein Q3G72_014201 [Acer saccharum]|nr:hypothetical protein Q3G72_014201 [Acer saccharum]
MTDSPPLKEKINSRKPKQYSVFSQQELPAFKLILTPGSVIASFLLLGIIFIPIGLASLVASEKVVEVVYRYDLDCVPSNYTNNKLGFIQNPQIDKTCHKKLTIPKDMKSPIFVYYEIRGFYQNHRRYVTSKSEKQLMKKSYESETVSCSQEANTSNNATIVPCGLIAWSLFNDTYGFTIEDKPLPINKKNIAWQSDTKNKFGSDVYPQNFQSGSLVGGAKLNSTIPLSEQEDLIVWMRTAAMPHFRKLYGKIERDLKAKDVITSEIQNNYNIYGFDGQKKLVLSTATWIGGKNIFLAVAYILIGGICFLLGIVFILLYMYMPRPLGDPSYLTWNQNQK